MSQILIKGQKVTKSEQFNVTNSAQISKKLQHLKNDLNVKNLEQKLVTYFWLQDCQKEKKILFRFCNFCSFFRFFSFKFSKLFKFSDIYFFFNFSKITLLFLFSLKAYVSAKILNWHSLRHSHGADFLIIFLCLAFLSQLRQ